MVISNLGSTICYCSWLHGHLLPGKHRLLLFMVTWSSLTWEAPSVELTDIFKVRRLSQCRRAPCSLLTFSSYQGVLHKYFATSPSMCSVTFHAITRIYVPKWTIFGQNRYIVDCTPFWVLSGTFFI